MTFLQMAVHTEILSAVGGHITSTATPERVPEHLLVQLAGLMSATLDIQTTQGVRTVAVEGSGSLFGLFVQSSRQHVRNMQQGVCVQHQHWLPRG